MKRASVCILLWICAFFGAVHSHAIGISLDTIASWGRFPRFCIDTYRWSAGFFNGFDTTYVQGTGHPFNIKIKTDSWTDYYGFRFDNKTDMYMISDPSTSLGLYLTYMAVSVGYDINVSNYLFGRDDVRRRWKFGFNCMLFSVDLYFTNNDGGTRITRVRPEGARSIHPDFDFNDMETTSWGVDASYFFNHKRYSESAAFGFGRVQTKSAGTFFAGFSYSRLNYDFDFSNLPLNIQATLPDTWENDRYVVDTHNYFIKAGYGYNWVFRPKWVLGVSESPAIGLSRGYIRTDDPSGKTTFGAASITRLSLVYNSGHWFAGGIGNLNINIARNRERALISSIISLEISTGFRFSLW